MLRIGCHLSVSDGYLSAAKTAVSIGANTFQYFSRNPRGGTARAVDPVDIEAFNKFIEKNGFAPVLAHAPYTLNAASATEATRDFAYECMLGDLKTLRLLNHTQYNFHPGSHTGVGVEPGIAYIIDLLNRTVDADFPGWVLLETMSGKGSELGVDFKQLCTIIQGTECSDKIGVTFDTCHLFAAGYDIVNNLDNVLEQFDKTVGLDRLKAVHLNDSMMPYNSRKDRHAKIGQGFIGADALVRFINHKKLKGLPYYLETPNELNGYQKEISFLRKNYTE